MWTLINLLLTLDKRSIVKQGTLDYFCLPGHLRCFDKIKMATGLEVRKYRLIYIMKVCNENYHNTL